MTTEDLEKYIEDNDIPHEAVRTCDRDALEHLEYSCSSTFHRMRNRIKELELGMPSNKYDELCSVLTEVLMQLGPESELSRRVRDVVGWKK